MQKRGQATIFVIIGIVLIILILLFVFLRTKVYLGPTSRENLEAQFPQIQDHIQNCIAEVAEPRLRQIGLQGGFIDTPENTFRTYLDNRVSILCYDIKDTPLCRSRVLTISDMEQELSQYIEEELQRECLSIQSYDKLGFELTQGSLNVETSIGQDTVLVTATIPITISKGSSRAEQSEFTETIEVPLGRLYDAMRDIVNSEALTGDFDTLIYSVAQTQLTNKPYIIQKLQPYPDKLYIMKIKDTPSSDNPYIFQFFVEGEPR